MQNVCITMNVYLITVYDLYKGMKFHVRATLVGAQNLFKKIVKEKYFDLSEDTEKDLKAECDFGFWESKRGDVVKYSKCTAVAEGENLKVVE